MPEAVELKLITLCSEPIKLVSNGSIFCRACWASPDAPLLKAQMRPLTPVCIAVANIETGEAIALTNAVERLGSISVII